MSETKVSALGLVKYEGDLPNQLYSDTTSPALKKIGQVFETILDVGNTILWPVKWVNKRTAIYFENNLNKYAEKLEAVEDEKIIPVAPEIAVPIIERFGYVSNEELSNAFVKLLTSASSSDTVNTAHPAFISLIDRITPDEAKIIKYFIDNGSLALLAIGWYPAEGRNSYTQLVKDACLLVERVDLIFPHNYQLYLDNLVSLGILQKASYYATNIENDYDEIKARLTDLMESHKPNHVKEKQIQFAENLGKEAAKKHVETQYLRTERSSAFLTELGKSFCKACIE